MFSRRMRRIAVRFRSEFRGLLQEIITDRVGLAGLPRQALAHAARKFRNQYGSKQLYAQLGVHNSQGLDYLDTLRATRGEAFLYESEDGIQIFRYITIPIYQTMFKPHIVTVTKNNQADPPRVLLTHSTLSDSILVSLADYQTSQRVGEQRYVNKRAVRLTSNGLR